VGGDSSRGIIGDQGFPFSSRRRKGKKKKKKSRRARSKRKRWGGDLQEKKTEEQHEFSAGKGDEACALYTQPCLKEGKKGEKILLVRRGEGKGKYKRKGRFERKKGEGVQSWIRLVEVPRRAHEEDMFSLCPAERREKGKIRSRKGRKKRHPAKEKERAAAPPEREVLVRVFCSVS